MGGAGRVVRRPVTRPPPEPPAPEPPAPERPDDEGAPIGPFPSWGALYATVVVWALALVVLLYLFTVFLNVGAAAP